MDIKNMVEKYPNYNSLYSPGHQLPTMIKKITLDPKNWSYSAESTCGISIETTAAALDNSVMEIQECFPYAKQRS